MNICYPFCDPKGGGTEWHALYLAREAEKCGHKVFFVFNGDGYLVDEVKKDGFQYDEISMASSFNPFRVIRSVINLRNYFKENRIDLVHAHMLREHSLAIGAKLLGAKIKIVRTFHRTDQFNNKMKPLMGIYNKNTDAFISISDYMIGHLKEHGIKGRIELIYNGVTRIDVKKHEAALGFMGRIVPEKGILKFVEENQILFTPKLPMYIGGVGEDFDSVESLVKEAGNKNIHVLGRVHEPSKFFEKISVFVLPASHEVLPLVALEAFSCGIPLVAFDLPVLKELVNGKNGFLIRQGDYKALAEKALELLKSPKLSDFSDAAKDSYEKNYTIDLMWQKTEALYKSLMD